MASTDWTLISDGGSSSIESDAGAPSAPSVIKLLGKLAYQNISGGTIQNGGINTWIKLPGGGVGEVDLSLRAQDSLFDTGDRYLAHIVISGASWIVQIYRLDSGTFTQLYSNTISPLVNNSDDWQRWRFSAINSGGNVLLRLELWNGSAFVVITDITDTSSLKITAAGNMRFAQESTSRACFVDDVQLFSLA